jgi:hypothetical protein
MDSLLKLVLCVVGGIIIVAFGIFCGLKWPSLRVEGQKDYFSKERRQERKAARLKKKEEQLLRRAAEAQQKYAACRRKATPVV